MKKLNMIVWTLITIILMSMFFSLNTNAIDLTQTKGSLTIIKYETGAAGHEGENIPLAGVEFSIYKVADDATSTTTPASTVQPTDTKITGTNGQAIFSNIDIGRYLVVETNAPENVTERIQNFLVDIPQTNATGTDINYNVTVEPKNNSAYGTITLIKEGINSAKLQNVTFVLQKKSGTNTWADYPNATDAILSTNGNGQIQVDNLPKGNYRFVETSLGNNTGYILDNQTTYEFNVDLNTTTFQTVVTPSTITIKNDKPGIAKEIDHITRIAANTNTVTDEKNSADIGDTLTYKTETDIPNTIARLNTYKITDTMDNGLTFKTTNFTVKSGSTTLTNVTDYTITPMTGNHGFVLEINNSGKEKLDTAYRAGSKKMEVKYEATLNSDADATSTGNKNKAKLSYSNIVNENYKGESNNPEEASKITTTNEVETKVYTGGILIEKRENSSSGSLLPGATFKIAATRTDANNSNFIKDSNGAEITLTTGTNGRASYKGLTYGTYYLVETQAPSYEVDGNTKYYNLLNKPVQITVSNNTYTQNANVVINRKPTKLPDTGAIGGVSIALVGVAIISLGIILNKKK